MEALRYFRNQNTFDIIKATLHTVQNLEVLAYLISPQCDQNLMTFLAQWSKRCRY